MNDQKNLLQTIDGIKIGKRKRKPKRLGLDKGYDSDELRNEIRKRRIIPNATYRKNRLDKPRIGRPTKDKQEKKYCHQRWKVERTFSWTNNNRRLDRLLECYQKSYKTFVRIYIIKHYLKLLC